MVVFTFQFYPVCNFGKFVGLGTARSESVKKNLLKCFVFWLLIFHCLYLPSERFHGMKSCPGTYYLIVVEDTELEKIVACGTLIIEQKFIHEIALVCVLVTIILCLIFHCLSLSLSQNQNLEMLALCFL